MRYASVIDAIGHTPLVRLRLPEDVRTEVHAKLELQNLYGMKDRVARRIILHARESGELAPGAAIVESSSGTMACGVALVGAALGHPVYIVTDPRIDPITLAKLRALGADVRVVEKMTGAGWQSARLEALEELRRTLPGSFWPQQYSNPMNPAAYAALADELLDDLGHIDVLVGSVGSGGSLCGTARALRRTLPDLRVVGIDAVGSALFDQPDRPTRLQSGLGNSLVPANLDPDQIDEVHWLTDREAFEATHRLAAEQALFAGNTSGSVYAVLGHVAANAAPGSRIVGIFPDRGDRYHDTVYSDAYWSRHGLPDQPVRTRPRRIRYGVEATEWSYAVLTPRPAGRPAPDGREATAVPGHERTQHGVPAVAVR
jgi:cysteine synthase A